MDSATLELVNKLLNLLQIKLLALTRLNLIDDSASDNFSILILCLQF